MTYSASPSIYHILALLFPQTGASSGLGHLGSSLSRRDTHFWRGSLCLPLGRKSYEMPTPKHVQPTLPKLPGPCVGLEELQQVEKTIIPPLSALERKPCSDKETKCPERKHVSAPALICKLILPIPSRQNTVTHNSPKKKGSHNPFFFFKSNSTTGTAFQNGRDTLRR